VYLRGLARRERVPDNAGVLLALLLVIAGCGGGDGGTVDASADASNDAGPRGSITIGGDRPARVVLPFDPSGPLPVVVLLHGYSISGTVQDAYFRTTRRARDNGFALVLPDGTIDDTGNRFWNALPEWMGRTYALDDVAYILGLVDELAGVIDVDPARIYLVGHSNGAFMAHRIACDAADRITAFVSLAGSGYLDPADCVASVPVSLLSVHGDADDTIPYAGTTGYPGVVEITERWAARDGCDITMPTAGDPIDADGAIPGAETEVVRYDVGCTTGFDVDLWTIRGGGHLPAITDEAIDGLIAWLLAHSR